MVVVVVVAAFTVCLPADGWQTQHPRQFLVSRRCVSVCMYGWMCLYVSVWMYGCVCMCLVYMCLYGYIDMSVWMCLYVSVWMYTVSTVIISCTNFGEDI